MYVKIYCMHVCICMCMHVCVYACTCMHVCMYTHMTIQSTWGVIQSNTSSEAKLEGILCHVSVKGTYV